MNKKDNVALYSEEAKKKYLLKVKNRKNKKTVVVLDSEEPKTKHLL